MKSIKQSFILQAVVAATITGSSMAGSPHTEVWPKPQQVKVEKDSEFTAIGLAASGVEDTSALALLFKGADVKPSGEIAIKIVTGDAANKALSEAKARQVSGAHILEIRAKEVKIIAATQAGVFYATQTLKQMIESDGELVVCRIVDWPDMDFRGSIEGFYGKPWEHERRLSQIQFYGKYKMNAYVYGPKDDPYSGFNSNKWRDEYPAEQAKQITELVEEAEKNHVNFIWALHPGSSIRWDDKDGDGIADDTIKAMKKLEAMYDLGVRSFAIFFDDIGGEGAKGGKQAQMLNYINREFISKKDDVAPLLMCPTDYAGHHGSEYKKTLGSELDKDVNIMWTGPRICADIPADSVKEVTKHWQRKPFIWWNWPVNDYCRTNLLMGRTYGLHKGNKGLLAGFASNPMDKPEASKLGLFSIADWAWNVDGFDSYKSWRAAFPRLYPELADEMYLFAKHNSDQGKNGHGYRREESVEIRPAVEKALEQYRKNKKLSPSDAALLMKEFTAIRKAAQKIKETLPKTDPALWHEIEYWVKPFEELGNAGVAAVKLASGNVGNGEAHMELFSAIATAKANHKESFEAQKKRHFEETFASDKRWATGGKVATLVMTPLVDELYTTEWKKASALLSGGDGNANSNNAVYKAFSNAKGLEKIQADRDGIYVSLRRVLEVVKLAPDEYIGLALPEGVHANYIHLKLNNAQAADSCVVEISTDGKNWKPFNARKGKGERQNPLNVNDKIRFFRLRNVSKKGIEFRIEKFKFDIPKDASDNSEAAMTDGDPISFYTLSEQKVFTGPAGAKKAFIISDAPKSALRQQGNKLTVIPKNGESVRVFEIIWR